MVPWAWRDCSAEAEGRIRREGKRMWKKVGKSLAKRLDNIRYHYDDIGHDGSTNRTPDRAGETAADSTESDASREPERAIQRLRQARLPLQRCQESPETRALLPAQLYLAWPGRHSFRAGRAAGGDAAETRQLQTFPGTERGVGGSSVGTGTSGAGAVAVDGGRCPQLAGRSWPSATDRVAVAWGGRRKGPVAGARATPVAATATPALRAEAGARRRKPALPVCGSDHCRRPGESGRAGSPGKPSFRDHETSPRQRSWTQTAAGIFGASSRGVRLGGSATAMSGLPETAAAHRRGR